MRQGNLKKSMSKRLEVVMKSLKSIKTQEKQVNLNNPKKMNQSLNIFKKLKEAQLKLEEEKALLQVALKSIRKIKNSDCIN